MSENSQYVATYNITILARRIWIGLAIVALFFLGVSPVYGGRKDDQIERTYLLLGRCIQMTTWFKSNFEYRAEILEKKTNKPFDLAYVYQSSTGDDKVENLIVKVGVKGVSSAEVKKYAQETEEHIKACVVELKKIEADLIKAEALVPKTPIKENINVIPGSIFGTDIDAARFGVILDISGSMTDYLGRLREEISEDFPDAVLAEVTGCMFQQSLEVPWIFIDPHSSNQVQPKVPTWEIMSKSVTKTMSRSVTNYWNLNTASAFSAMIDMKNVDAIYWFADFEDSYDNDAIKKLSDYILEKNITLYVHTLQKDPPKLISKLAKKSGGKVITKKF